MRAVEKGSVSRGGDTGLLSDTGHAAHMSGFFKWTSLAYGSVFNLNSGKWVAFSEFLSQLKMFG